MYRDATVGVVIPAYNEAEHVGEVIETLPGFVDRAYVVDDCSTDATWDVVSEYTDPPRQSVPGDHPRSSVSRPEVAMDGGASGTTSSGSSTNADLEAFGTGEPPGDGPPIVAVRHSENRGVGGAIKTGYRLALADEMDVTAVMNGDGQMGPDYLDRIIDPVVDGRADYAKGTRLSHPRYVAPMPRWRRFGNRLLTNLTRVSTGYWDLEDSQNGYTAISRRALSELQISELYERYGFLNDVLAALSERGMRVVDVPHPAKYGDEQSEIRYRSFVPRLSVLLLKNFLKRIYRPSETSPVAPANVGYLLGGIGCVVAGLAALAAVVSAAVGAGGLSIWIAPVAITVGLITAVGALAVDARRGQRTESRPGDPKDIGERGDGG